MTYAAPGQACGTNVECAASAACIGGTCVAPTDPFVDGGGACDDTHGPPCPYPFRCASGTCVMPDGSRCARLYDAGPG